MWLYVTVTGGNDGIMLFTRGLYLCFGVGVAGVVFHVLRGHMPGIAAGFTALVCAVYAHFNIFNLSYNSMASGFLVIGIMLGIAGVAGTRRPLLHLLLSGTAHGWLPSLRAGVMAAWSSTNGLANAAVGLLPACLITNVVIVLWAW